MSKISQIVLNINSADSCQYDVKPILLPIEKIKRSVFTDLPSLEDAFYHKRDFPLDTQTGERFHFEVCPKCASGVLSNFIIRNTTNVSGPNRIFLNDSTELLLTFLKNRYSKIGFENPIQLAIDETQHELEHYREACKQGFFSTFHIDAWSCLSRSPENKLNISSSFVVGCISSPKETIYNLDELINSLYSITAAPTKLSEGDINTLKGLENIKNNKQIILSAYLNGVARDLM